LRFKKPLSLLIVAVLLTVSGSSYSANFPDRPTDPESLIFDYANILNDTSKDSLHKIQAETFTQHKIPIVVVTIQQMSNYGLTGISIKSFAREWFDYWQIGTKENNRGILLLVSVGNRRARIELGADWGRGWDSYSQDIMDNAIIPYFKKSNYPAGIVAGVQKLAKMAANPPGASPSDTLSLFEKLSKIFSNPLNIMLIIGIALVAASFFFPEYRKYMLITGIILIIGYFAFTLVLMALFIYGKHKLGLGSGSSGGGFSGSFGGGSSGGGGASGGW